MNHQFVVMALSALIAHTVCYFKGHVWGEFDIGDHERTFYRNVPGCTRCGKVDVKHLFEPEMKRLDALRDDLYARIEALGLPRPDVPTSPTVH